MLGLIAQEGPATPYELKRRVARSVGNFWSFPHAQLYREPERLAVAGLLSEEREESGRHRRVFAITATGRDALAEWLRATAARPPEVRDPALLQLYFSEFGAPLDRRTLAEAQIALHRAKLAHDEGIRDTFDEFAALQPQAAAEARWRVETLRMGILYERANLRFWSEVRDASD